MKKIMRGYKIVEKMMISSSAMKALDIEIKVEKFGNTMRMKTE